jgi:hypothetical protein
VLWTAAARQLRSREIAADKIADVACVLLKRTLARFGAAVSAKSSPLARAEPQNAAEAETRAKGKPYMPLNSAQLTELVLRARHKAPPLVSPPPSLLQLIVVAAPVSPCLHRKRHQRRS